MIERTTLRAAAWCLFLMFPFGVIGVLASSGSASELRAVEANGTDSSDLDRAIGNATGYLMHSASADGKLLYQVDTMSGASAPLYNVVRHAGVIASLGMLDGDLCSPEVKRSILSLAKYMKRNYVGPGLHAEQVAVWSEPFPRAGELKLGATGLGLVALLKARHIDERIVSLGELQGLARTLVYLQKPDGSFVEMYRPGLGPDLNWHAPFYPGEAALALVSLYKVDHNPEWLASACKALAYLARSRARSAVVPEDHWALIATAELIQYCDEKACIATRQELINHAVQICNELLRMQQIVPDNPTLDGSFDPLGHPAIAGAALEGLLAAYEFLPDDQKVLRTRIKVAASRGVVFLMRAQIKSGPYTGGMPLTAGPSESGTVIIRIDFVQHALSAWIRYRKLFGSALQDAKQSVSPLN